MEGSELDLAVANALNIDAILQTLGGYKHCFEVGGSNRIPIKKYSPSTDWSQGGPLIEEYAICLDIHPLEDDSGIYWTALVNVTEAEGPTPLIAAMRALVNSKEKE
jgi:hypothetical protein